jgi:Peptidase family M28
MKKPYLLALLLYVSCAGFSQPANLLVTSAEVDNILKGVYVPSVYSASVVISNPGIISTSLVNGISPDSLKKTLFALKGFRNRNSGSDTVSSSFGIGAARRWVYNKFMQFSAANDDRLRPAYLQFDLNMCGATRHRNVIAVLPGRQVTDKSVILIEAHMDSRCESLCDIGCNAFGIEDNATGTALVLELARVLSQYTFNNTIVFAITTGEEQGTDGALALATYFRNANIAVKAVNNNDVSGGIFCGHTSSAPSCPFFGNIDSTGLRIFSLGGFNSPHKQWARYVKLQYQEQVGSLVTIPTDIQIMTNEDRTGRGGDHQPFRQKGYTAVRFTAANENGNANIGPGYIDRQHSLRDSLGIDKDNDGIEDSLYVSVNYLARNALVNGTSMAMAAMSPDTITLTPALITQNLVRVQFNSVTPQPAYRVAIRSLTNDWDSVYTITGKTTDTIIVPYGTNATFFISAASVNSEGVESLFSTEYNMTLQLVALPLNHTPAAQQNNPLTHNIQLLQNKPNPFDESTMITILSGTDIFFDRAWINIADLSGRMIRRIKIPLKKGVNEVSFNHGYGSMKGVYVYTLFIDGLPVQSRKMVLGK